MANDSICPDCEGPLGDGFEDCMTCAGFVDGKNAGRTEERRRIVEWLNSDDHWFEGRQGNWSHLARQITEGAHLERTDGK